ncbi:hypothetical protein GBA52_024386 [Prunus armeniaca]|nr:hypothetical protein GBA52_024386 [Prunus armeniaca]
MVLLNSLRVIPPEDPLGEDATDQPVLEVIEVFVDVFAIEPSEVFIDATLLHEDEFDFELAYITTRHIDFQEHFDELMANATHSVSSDSNLSENELEDDPWASSTIDNIMRNVMFEK